MRCPQCNRITAYWRKTTNEIVCNQCGSVTIRRSTVNDFPTISKQIHEYPYKKNRNKNNSVFDRILDQIIDDR